MHDSIHSPVSISILSSVVLSLVEMDPEHALVSMASCVASSYPAVAVFLQEIEKWSAHQYPAQWAWQKAQPLL